LGFPKKNGGSGEWKERGPGKVISDQPGPQVDWGGRRGTSIKVKGREEGRAAN